jgi:hypothetical protein
MIMWLRLAGALLVTLAAIGALEYFGVGRLLGGRSADDASPAAQARAQELFWLGIFMVVWATSLLAAMRRWAGHFHSFAVRQARRGRG